MIGALLVSESRRVFRSPRFLIFTVGLPVVYFLIFAGIYGPDALPSLTVMMATFGAISASINVGGRVAVERGAGWNRQLRLTPLPAWGYLAVKAAVAMIVALPALLLVFLVAGLGKGVELDPSTWAQVVAAAWLGVLPFAAIGLLIGLVATPDSAQPMSAVAMLSLSLLGGVLIPVDVLPAAMVTVARLLPSYWVVDITTSVAAGGGVSLPGVGVLLAWLALAGGLVVLRYRRDAARV